MLKCLLNVNDHRLTVVAQHLAAIWRPKNVQKPMGSKKIIATGAQNILNFLIIKMKR